MHEGDTQAAVAAAAHRGRRLSAGSRARGWPQAVGRALAERRLVLATGLAASLPVLVAIVHALDVGWAPLGDDAVLAVRAVDILSSDPPLVGMPAGGATGVLDEQAYHLGPLLFWTLALPARYLGPSSLAVTVGLLNVAWIMGIVGVAHRRGGRPLMFAVAIAVPLMLVSIPAQMHSAVWNPAAALLPFTLLLFLAWSVACGDVRLLPLAVLVASFAAQCHLTYVLPALGALAVAGVGLAISLRSRGASDRRGPVRGWLVAAALVGLVCWSGPLIQQATESPGNLTVLARAGSADQPDLGPRVGVRAVAHAIGVPPWWLRSPRGALQRIGDLNALPGAPTTGSAVLVLVALAGVTVAGIRRRRRDVVAAGALGLVLCAALALAASEVPASAFATVGYSLWWASPVGLWVWLAVGLSLATLIAGSDRLAGVRRPALAGVVGLAAVVVVAGGVAATADPHDDSFAQIRSVNARLTAELASGRPVRVDARNPTDVFVANGFQLGIVYALRRDGYEVTAPSVEHVLGPRYGAGESEPAQVVSVDVDRRPAPGGKVVARVFVDPRDPDNPFSKAPPRSEVVVSLSPAGGAR